ncbi:hypothetical protein BFX79_09780 [Neisseria meningitidis]|nr:hypothetical protein BFX79_09780 [Neisseria meningitidis]
MQAGYSYPTKIFDASIVSEKPLLENVGFENRPMAKNCSKDKAKGRLNPVTTNFAETSAVIPAQAGIQTFRHGNLSDKRFL